MVHRARLELAYPKRAPVPETGVSAIPPSVHTGILQIQTTADLPLTPISPGRCSSYPGFHAPTGLTIRLRLAANSLLVRLSDTLSAVRVRFALANPLSFFQLRIRSSAGIYC